ALVMPLVTLVGFLLILSAWGMYGMFFPVISLGLFIAMFFSLKPLTDIKIIIGTLYSIATGFIVIIVFFYVVSGGQFFGHTEIITSSLSPNELFYVEISQHSTGATGGSSRIVVQSYPLGRSRIVYSGRWHSLKSSSQENGTVIIWEGDYIFRVRVADVRSLTFRYIDGKWQMTFPTRTRN
ncbi:MAG: DUF5412 domain-containing protein, partial [Oscillospiraceae bacterium]|nr:DUF5412 domain-containing protein [Oscillospiraceae bacterium]